MSEPSGFLDTNVLLRHVLQDHTEHSPRATAFLHLVRQQQQIVLVSDSVIFEAVFTLEKFYRVPRIEIRAALEPIIELPGIVLPTKAAYRETFDHYVAQVGLSFADCFHVVQSIQRTGGRIHSFDRKLGRVAGVDRIEP